MASNIVHCPRCKYPYTDVEKEARYIVQHGQCPSCAAQDDEKEIDKLRDQLSAAEMRIGKYVDQIRKLHELNDLEVNVKREQRAEITRLRDALELHLPDCTEDRCATCSVYDDPGECAERQAAIAIYGWKLRETDNGGYPGCEEGDGVDA
jgi:hypothetical protein